MNHFFDLTKITAADGSIMPITEWLDCGDQRRAQWNRPSTGGMFKKNK